MKKNKKYLFLVSLCASLCAFLPAGYAAESAATKDADDFSFDESMLLGEATTKGLSDRDNYYKNRQGDYYVDIFLNGSFIDSGKVNFKKDANGKVLPCFTGKQLSVFPLKSKKNVSPPIQCLFLNELIKGASYDFSVEKLRLNVLIPQSELISLPRGYINPDMLTHGNNVFFMNYDANYFNSKSNGFNSDSIYFGLKSGLNIGPWQLRQQSIFNQYKSSGAASSSNFKAIRSYAQRDIIAINSQIVAGQTFTKGDIFSSIGFNGINLFSDERMLPSSQRGYAPTVRGFVNTTSKITIRQRGDEIYQTTVPPGNYVINDLYPTSYQGELTVDVEGSDGKKTSFVVPFASVPNSLRPGTSRYYFSAGRTNSFKKVNANFIDLIYRRGLSNIITADSGLRLSNGYRSISLGGAILTPFGALGFRSNYSEANLIRKTLKGFRTGVDYSRTFDTTNTTVTIANYRYSTPDYMDLNDTLGLKESFKNGSSWTSPTYKQKTQYVLSINQGLYGYGQVYLSGTITKYRDRTDDQSIQAGYSNSYKFVNYNLNYSRTSYGNSVYNSDYVMNTGRENKKEDIFSISFSVPLDVFDSKYSPNLTSSYSHSRDNQNYQTALSGVLGENNTYSYNIHANHDSNNSGTSGGANLSKQLPYASVGANYSKGSSYSQYGANAQGSAIIHGGGVNFAPYLSETFGIIEANGAEGASIYNSYGSTISANGYGVIPSLVPYTKNDVTIDPNTNNSNVEIAENIKSVYPYSGAAAFLKFKTIVGYPLLVQLSGNSIKPEIGSAVYDEKNNPIGFVGQGYNVYVRTDKNSGFLIIDYENNKKCRINYSVDFNKVKKDLYIINGKCI